MSNVYYFAKKYNLKKIFGNNGIIFYGQYKNFNISISFFKEGNSINNLIKIYGDFSNPELSSKINNAYNELKINKYVKNLLINNSISVILSKPLGAIKSEEFELVLDKLHEAAGFSESVRNCEMCKNPENTRIVIASDRVEPLCLCEKCYTELNAKYDKANLEMHYKPNNYLKGFLMGLLLSLFGVVLWILISLVGFIAGIAGYVITYLMYLGYKKAGGKINKTTSVIIIVLSLFMVIVAEYFSIAIYIQSYFSDQSYQLYFIDVLTSLPQLFAEEKEFLSACLTDLGVGFILTLLACLQLFRKMIFESKKSTLKVLN